MILVADTHSLLWFLQDSPKLSSTAKSAILDENNPVLVSTIVLAELKHQCSRNRLGARYESLYTEILRLRSVVIKPVLADIIALMPAELEIHDAIIVATALREQQLTGEKCPIVTCDRPIAESGLVEV